MTRERWAQVKDLYYSVVDRQPDERRKRLDGLRLIDPALCDELESLLRESTHSWDPGANPFDNIDLLGNSKAQTPAEAIPGVTPPLGVLSDRYRLERAIGQGSFGTVFLARDQRLHDKPVVIKFLTGAAPPDDWFRKKFQDEIKALARIDHPGVIGILDAGQTDYGIHYLVMQYAEGATLRTLIRAGGMEPARVAHILRQICEALDAAHARGVFHRDLKPENIIVQQAASGEFVRLIDFGIATIREEGLERDSGTPTRVVGSVAYMAPEQFRGLATEASDVFAVAVIAWEMLTGEVPFGNTSPVEVIAGQMAGAKLDGLHAQRPDVSAAAIAVLRRALSVDPSERFQSATAFGDQLAQSLVSVRTDVPAASPAPTLQQRVLDAAIARQIPVYKPAELVAQIRRTESGGLGAVLRVEEEYSVKPEDVRSKPFQLEFPLDQTGRMKPLELHLRVDCPDFKPKSAVKTIQIPPAGDSEVCTFLIAPRFVGELRLNLEVLQGETLVSSRLLKTEARPSERYITDPSKAVVSIALPVLARSAEVTPVVPVPPAPLEMTAAAGASATGKAPAISEFSRMFMPPDKPRQPTPAERRREPSGFTRLFMEAERSKEQAAPADQKQPGEFSRMLTSPATPGPPQANPFGAGDPPSTPAPAAAAMDATEALGPRPPEVGPPANFQPIPSDHTLKLPVQPLPQQKSSPPSNRRTLQVWVAILGPIFVLAIVIMLFLAMRKN